MNTCTFLGHREIRENIDAKLTNILTTLIEQENIENFYVGNHGAFDKTVIKILRNLKKRYPKIRYSVVLAYFPSKEDLTTYTFSETIYPEGFENILPKYAIINRNHWMIEQADIIVTYIRHPFGGAIKSKEYAERRGKRIINIAE